MHGELEKMKQKVKAADVPGQVQLLLAAQAGVTRDAAKHAQSQEQLVCARAAAEACPTPTKEQRAARDELEAAIAALQDADQTEERLEEQMDETLQRMFTLDALEKEEGEAAQEQEAARNELHEANAYEMQMDEIGMDEFMQKAAARSQAARQRVKESGERVTTIRTKLEQARKEMPNPHQAIQTAQAELSEARAASTAAQERVQEAMKRIQRTKTRLGGRYI